MIRVLSFAFLGAILGELLTHNRIGVLVGFFGVLGVMLYAVASGKQKLRCPYCRKRVKLGAPACHHCARSVV